MEFTLKAKIIKNHLLDKTLNTSLKLQQQRLLTSAIPLVVKKIELIPAAQPASTSETRSPTIQHFLGSKLKSFKHSNINLGDGFRYSQGLSGVPIAQQTREKSLSPKPNNSIIRRLHKSTSFMVNKPRPTPLWLEKRKNSHFFFCNLAKLDLTSGSN